MSEEFGDLSEALGWGHERVHLVEDRASGLRAVIAIHSTVLGPSLGGMRIRAYEGGMAAALDDALRLSRAMTLKASAAGLDLGGGKSVLLEDGRPERRRDRLEAMAREIERLDGAYITAEDIGTTTADMDFLAEHTDHVVGRSVVGGGDPSPDTARTVLGAIRAALQVLDGDESLPGRRVGIVGLGKVGGRLAEWLLGAGAHVIGFDPVPATRARMAAAGVELVDSAAAVVDHELDVFAPCAVGGMIDSGVTAALRCRVVCGSANNPLADGAAQGLGARDILYVPDFMANCGGLIHVDFERRRENDPEHREVALAEARERTAAVLAEAVESGRLPLEIAEEHALERIRSAGAAVRRTSARV
jgi:glutamate dehydrogenase/leucine dehydrogenase